MIGGKKIFLNTLWLMLSSVFNLGVSIFTTSIIARSVGPTLYGRYTFGLNYVYFFSVLANFGLESLFVREAAKDKKRIDMANDIFCLKILLAIFATSVVVLSANVLRYPDASLKVIYIFSVGLFFQILYDSLMSVYRSLEKMHFMAFFSTAFRVLSALIIVLAIYSGIGFFGIVSAFSIANFVLFLAALFLARRNYKIPNIHVDVRRWLDLMRQGMPFYLSALLTMFYARINVLILSKMVDEAHMGFYMAALNLVESLFFMIVAFNTSIFPAFSRLYGSSFEALRMTYQRVTKYLIMAGTAVCMGTILVADKVVILIYGSDFIVAAQVLRVLIFFWWFTFFSNVQSNLLFSIGRETAQVKIMAIACGASVVCNLAFIHWFGVLGAAFSSVITEAIVVGAITVLLRRSDLRYKPDGHMLRIIFPIIAMTVAVFVLIKVNVFLAVAVGGASYFVSLFIAKVFDSSDIGYMKALIGGRIHHD